MRVMDLYKQGFVTIPYPEEMRRCVLEAMSSWQTFSSLPPEIKRRFSKGDRVKDFGYMRREDPGKAADPKELFHVRGMELTEMLQIADAVDNLQALHFIHAVTDLIMATKPVVVQFARLVEETYGIRGFGSDVENSAERWFFRYLHYFPGETLANSHVDRGGFTLHLDETCGGGEYLCPDTRQWKPWPVSHDETIIFPSMVLQHRSRGLLKALCHRVQSCAESRVAGRYAMVLFIDFPHSHRVNDSKHRMQDLPEGFNYDHPFDEEFTKLFEEGLVNQP